MSRMADYFEYLDDLRHSGRTNMYGARPYLTRDMGLDEKEARDVLVAWMKTFDPDKTPEERARSVALSSAQSTGATE